jgi:hypothetical protein
VISTAIRVARVGNRTELASALLLVLGYPGLTASALIPSVWGFVAAGAVTYLADRYLHHRGSYLINRLGKIRAGLSIRFLVRELLLILLLARMGLSTHPVFYGAIACFLVFFGFQGPHGALTTLIKLRRALPVATRNVDLSRISIPDAPPRRLTSRAAEKMLHLDLPAVVGLIVTAQANAPVWGFAGIAVTLVLGLGYLVALVPYVRGRRIPSRAEVVLDKVDDWLRSYRPETVLYFSGSKDSAYQVNMWLETLEQLDTRPLVILRERVILKKLARTGVPVICVPGGVHLMNMDLSTVRVALYAANVGKNIHMLRLPTMKHVFIGHGDSDKSASVNPFSKVYDEVWTAGRAGRDRYALADVGIRDEDIVEVGRPQLAPIQHFSGPPKDRVPTVLYAPTWEGWDDAPGNTSLLSAGENIIRGLLAAEPAVRVLYKPHPFTGTRSKEAKAVHARLVTLVEKATARRGADPAWTHGAAAEAAARAELARIEGELSRLGGGSGDERDEAEASRDGIADPEREALAKRLREEWNAAYWRSFPSWEHRVISGAEPPLYDCFNVSDCMVSDISSVVSDFIASGKPYAVTDSAEIGAEEFKRQNTAVRAAVILSNSATELDELLAGVRGAGADPLAAARTELKEYLLGPDEPTSMQRFNAAVRDLGAKAEARNEAQGAMADLEGIPAQRGGLAAEPGPGAAVSAGASASASAESEAPIP